MTPREKMDEIYRLNARRNKLTLIQVVGVVILLAIQFSLAPFVGKSVPVEVMMFYPLSVLAWGIFFVVAIIRINIKVRRLGNEIAEELRRVREQ